MNSFSSRNSYWGKKEIVAFIIEYINMTADAEQ